MRQSPPVALFSAPNIVREHALPSTTFHRMQLLTCNSPARILRRFQMLIRLKHLLQFSRGLQCDVDCNKPSTSDTLSLNNYITVYPYPAPQAIAQNGDTLIANQGAISYRGFTTEFQSQVQQIIFMWQAKAVTTMLWLPMPMVVKSKFDVVAGVESLFNDSNCLWFIPILRVNTYSCAASFCRKMAWSSIFNMLGEKIFSPTPGAAKNNLQTIDVGKFPRGFYFIEIFSG